MHPTFLKDRVAAVTAFCFGSFSSSSLTWPRS